MSSRHALGTCILRADRDRANWTYLVSSIGFCYDTHFQKAGGGAGILLSICPSDWLCACVSVSVCARARVCIRVHLSLCVCVCMCVCVSVFVSVCARGGS
jgi:hypothetical protein